MAELMGYLKKAKELGASDVYIVAGCPASAKCRGEFHPLHEDKLMPPQTEALISGLYALAKRSMDSYRRGCRDSFTFSVPGLARFRVNAYRQRGSMAAVVRVVAFEIPDWQELNIPETVMELADLKRGLLLFTGGAESGKSTTEACVIDRINHTRSCHIVTIEDPIEFLYRDEKCIISQQEVGTDVEDMLAGLRSCMQQAPDVVMMGDLLDEDLLRAAMAAAEGGRLVIASVPTKGSIRVVSRLVELFPAEQQDYARVQLSHVLRAVVSQQLLPTTDGGLIPSFELLTFNRFISGMFRDKRENEIAAAVIAGRGDGFSAMDQAVTQLYREEKITLDTALTCADNPEQMRRRCG